MWVTPQIWWYMFSHRQGCSSNLPLDFALVSSDLAVTQASLGGGLIDELSPQPNVKTEDVGFHGEPIKMRISAEKRISQLQVDTV